jgi:hypothetical protein
MTGPDRPNEPEWPIRPEPNEVPVATSPVETGTARTTEVVRTRRGINPLLFALAGLVVILFLAWLFTGNRSPDQDKLTGNSSEQARAADDPEKRCASKATYETIKRDLFRRAAQVRGSDQAAFDKLSAYATLRMENPVLESENGDNHASNCSGTLYLDLPPGVAAVGGRRTLSADVDYTVQPAADGSGTVVLLKNADAVITPLATLSRTAQPAPTQQPSASEPEPVIPPGDAGAFPPRPSAPQPATAPAPPPQHQPEASTHSARPSFNCENARTRGEIAVCGDSGLAALDRQMAAQFGRAISSGDAGQRALLQRTRSRFLSYRDSCRSDACIADSYRGRMREISDIMAGRWRPQ